MPTSFFEGTPDGSPYWTCSPRCRHGARAGSSGGHHVKPAATMEDFHRLPVMDKENYHRRYPLPERCRGGRLDGCDMVAVSSGSSGRPTVWPRSLTDELDIARRFERIFRGGFVRTSAHYARGGLFPAGHLGRWPVHYGVRATSGGEGLSDHGGRARQRQQG